MPSLLLFSPRQEGVVYRGFWSKEERKVETFFVFFSGKSFSIRWRTGRVASLVVFTANWFRRYLLELS